MNENHDAKGRFASGASGAGRAERLVALRAKVAHSVLAGRSNAIVQGRLKTIDKAIRHAKAEARVDAAQPKSIADSLTGRRIYGDGSNRKKDWR